MRATWILSLLAALAIICGSARASSIIVDLADANGGPAANAVIALEPVNGERVTSHLPDEAVIDQRHETFVPMVVVVRKGGRVVFTNNDVTKHQVYSFSAIKQFQFVIGQGEVSQPVEFSKSGIVAIGCNIHDQMIAYAFVGEATYAAVTDGTGHAIVADVRKGRYRVSLWHPQMGQAPAPVSELDVGEAGARFTAKLPFTLEAAHGMKHMHMDY